MADVKISALPASTTPLAGTEVLPIVQSGVTKKVSVADLTAGRAVSAASLTLTTSPLGVASGGTNQTAFTAKSGNVAGLVYFDGTSLATDATVTNVGYDTSTNTVQAKNFFASGTAVVTGNVTVNTNAAFVDATNKRLGVGTGSPTTALQVNSADRASFYIVSSDTGTSNQINIVNGSNFAAGTIGTYSGTGISGGDVWGLGYTTNPTGSDFTPILKWASAGDVTVSTGNLVIGTSDKGIDFSVTANSSGTMTSELLNDYEEGTWTATLTAGTTAPTTPITVTSKYTKIGRQVTVSASFRNVNTTGAAGIILVQGLPYTSVGRSFGALTLNMGTAAGVSNVPDGVTYILPLDWTGNNINIVAGTGKYLEFTATYFVS